MTLCPPHDWKCPLQSPVLSGLFEQHGWGLCSSKWQLLLISLSSLLLFFTLFFILLVYPLWLDCICTIYKTHHKTVSEHLLIWLWKKKNPENWNTFLIMLFQGSYLEIKKQMDKLDPLAHPLLQWWVKSICSKKWIYSALHAKVIILNN